MSSCDRESQPNSQAMPRVSGIASLLAKDFPRQAPIHARLCSMYCLDAKIRRNEVGRSRNQPHYLGVPRLFLLGKLVSRCLNAANLQVFPSRGKVTM